MTTNLTQVLIECLRERPSVAADVLIGGDTDLYKDLGIDSLEGIEITCELSDRLGIEIPEDENVLVVKEGSRRRMRKISEIAERLAELATQKAAVR